MGSIGAVSSDIYIGTSDTNLRFADNLPSVIPVGTAGATRDAAIDLGSSGNRYKDFYFSGGIYANNGFGSDGQVLTSDGAGNTRWEAVSGGGGSPGGSNTQVQFNNSGSFGGDSGFTYNSSTDAVSAGSFTATSDLAKKENLEVVDDALSKIQTLTGYTYDMKKNGIRKAGLIAQDVEKVLPEAVDGEEGEKTLDYNATIALLVNAVKEQQAQIKELKEKIEGK